MSHVKLAIAASIMIAAAPGYSRPKPYSISIELPEVHYITDKFRCSKKSKRMCTGRRIIPNELWNNPRAGTMYGEASNQPDAGIRAVGHVVNNRVRAQRKAWGLTTRQVAFKRKQFSWLNRSDPGLKRFKAMLAKPMSDPDRQKWEHIKYLSDHLGSDNTSGATSYTTNDWNTYWKYSMTVVGVMFDHTFFRPKTKAEWVSYRRDQAANAKLAKARKIAHKANRTKKSVHFVVKHSVKHR